MVTLLNEAMSKVETAIEMKDDTEYNAMVQDGSECNTSFHPCNYLGS